MAEGGQAGFSLFTSLRYDPILRDHPLNQSQKLSFTRGSEFYMLVYHRDRMLEAAHHFGWPRVIDQLQDGKKLERTLKERVQNHLQKSQGANSPSKIRILFNKLGEMELEITPVPEVDPDVLYPPSLPAPSKTSNTSEFTAPTSSRRPEWRFYIDTEPTPASSFTSLKTTQRLMYSNAQSRALPDSQASAAQKTANSFYEEVLMFNLCGEITEGSLTSVYLYRGGRWVTPPVGSSKPPKSGASNENHESSAKTATDQPTSDESDNLPHFAGRWGHSLRASTKWPDSGGQRGTTRRWALAEGLCVEELVDKSTVSIGEEVWVSNGVRGFGKGIVVK